jgi:hypothetical protein
MRKTIDVKWLVDTINQKLALPELSQEKKATLCCLVEEVLMQVDRYAGYNYLTWIAGGFEKWRAAGEPEDKNLFIGKEFDRHYYYKE